MSEKSPFEYQALAASQERLWPGLFISFEGGDGVGKSTQIKRLYERLDERGCDVVLTREPGGSKGAEEIRKLLVEGEPGRWSSMTEALLMIASRNDHLEKTILPALRGGAVVLCDRFIDSTMAYQGIAGDLGSERINGLHNLVIGDIVPDLTFVLTLSSEAGLARARARGQQDSSGNSSEDRFERKGRNFQEDVHKAFAQLQTLYPDRCIDVDTSGDIEKTSDTILDVIMERYSDAEFLTKRKS